MPAQHSPVRIIAARRSDQRVYLCNCADAARCQSKQQALVRVILGEIFRGGNQLSCFRALFSLVCLKPHSEREETEQQSEYTAHERHNASATSGFGERLG